MNSRHLTLVLPHSAAGDSFAVQQVRLEPADSNAIFALVPIGGRLGNDGNFEVGYTEWLCDFKGEVKVTVQFGAALTLQGTTRGLTLGLGTAAETFVLLQGRVKITPPPPAGNDAVWQFLWPTGARDHIVALLIEPSGLFVEGTGESLATLFAGKPPSTVALRAPQTGAPPDIFASFGIDSPPAFWVLEAFRFEADSNATATDFIQAHASHFNNFGRDTPQSTFIDSIVSTPDSDCRVLIWRDPLAARLLWLALGLGTRITIGGGSSAEASFYPQALRGATTVEGSSATFLAGTPVTPTITLTLADATPALSVMEQAMALVAVPTTPIAVDVAQQEAAQGEDPANATEQKDKQPPPPRRAWLYTDAGWLSYDSVTPLAELDPQKQTLGAIAGTLELAALYRTLDPPDAPGSDLGQVQVNTLKESYVAITLTSGGDTPTLTLELANVMIVMITPALWYRFPTPRANDNPAPSATVASAEGQLALLPANQLPALTVLSGVIETPQAALEQLFDPAVFVSTTIVKAQSAVTSITLQWNATTKVFQLQYGTAQGFQLWHRPAAYPLVQTYSISPTVRRDGYLDANRGLIPLALPPDQDSPLTIAFNDSRLLPTVAPAPPLAEPAAVTFAPWQVATHWRGTRLFLPTLPGVELMLGDDNRHVWLYRHSVPALDESYAEASENDTPANPRANGLGGRDFTRVVGTEAFEIKAGQVNVAGLLHQNAFTAVLSEIDLRGFEPHLTLATDDVSYSLPDAGNGAGASLYDFGVETTMQEADSGLPRFNVVPQADGTERIIRHGQSLLVHRRADGLITLDGAGLVQSEFNQGRIRYRNGNDEITRLTATFRASAEFGNALTLDLVNVSLDRAFAELTATDFEQESWLLHDGTGRVPRLLGFALMPLRIEMVHSDNGTVTVTLIAIWLPPGTGTAELPTGAGKTITLTLEGRLADNTLAVTDVTGAIEWRFGTDDARSTTAFLVGVEATVKSLAAGVVTLALDTLTVAHPLGLLRLAGLNREVELSSAGLTLAVDQAEEAFSYKLNKLHISPGGTEPYSLTDYDFEWRHPAGADVAHLHCVADGAEPVWQLRLSRGNAVNLIGVLALEVHPAASNRFIFTVKGYDGTGTAIDPTLTAGDWLQTEGTPEGFVAVQFAEDERGGRIDHLIAEIQFSVVERHPNDALLVWDPNARTMRTMDAATGQLGPMTGQKIAGFDLDSGQTVVWAIGNQAMRQWRLASNTVAPLPVTAVAPPSPPVVAPLGIHSVMPFNNEGVFVWVGEDQRVKLYNAKRGHDFIEESDEDIRVLSDNSTSGTVRFLTTAWRFGPKQVAWVVEDNDPTKTVVIFVEITDRITRTTINNPHKDNNQSITITALEIDKGGNLITASESGEILQWEPTAEPLIKRRIPATFADKPTGAVVALTLLDDGSWAVGYERGMILIWQAPRLTGFLSDLPFGQEDEQQFFLDQLNLDFEPKEIFYDGVSLVLPDAPATTNTNYTIRRNSALNRYYVFKGVESDVMQLVEPEVRDGIVSMVSLGQEERDEQHPDRIAVLYANGSVIEYHVPRKRDGTGTVMRRERTQLILETGHCKPSMLSTIKKRDAVDLASTLLIGGPTSTTRLMALVHFDRETGARLAVTGKLVLQNGITYQESSAQRCTHRVDLFFEQAEIPLEALFHERGPQQDASVSAVVEHTFRFGTFDPTSANTEATDRIREQSWQAPQVIRFTQRHRNPRLLEAEAEDATLVIDAGAVFWLKTIETPIVATHGAVVIENLALRLILHPQGRRRFEVGPARVLRLPTLFSPGKPNYPSVTLQADSDERVEYQTSGVQPPPISAPPFVELPLDYFHRTGQVLQGDVSRPHPLGLTINALNDGFLLQLLQPHASGPVSPAFAQADEVVPILSASSELEWLRRATGHSLAAATVVRQHEPDKATVALAGPTLAEFPFLVRFEGSQRQAIERGEVQGQCDVQLVRFRDGVLSKIAHEFVSIPSTDNRALLQWAREQLDLLRTEDAAFVLKEHHEVLIVPRSFAAFRETLPYALPALADEAQKLADPRCLPAGTIPSLLNQETALGLSIAGARAVSRQDEGAPNGEISATRFTLTTQAVSSHLLAVGSVLVDGGVSTTVLETIRPPLTQPNGLTLTQREAVLFQEATSTSAYPRVEAAMYHQRQPAPLKSEVGSTEATIVAPLVEVVAWSARPGEMTNSSWQLNDYGASYNSAPPVAVSLRRPRATAGTDQTVQVEIRTNPAERLYHDRFRQIAVRLTQRTETTPIPDEDLFLAAFVTKNEMVAIGFPGDTPPPQIATLYYEENKAANNPNTASSAIAIEAAEVRVIARGIQKPESSIRLLVDTEPATDRQMVDSSSWERLPASSDTAAALDTALWSLRFDLADLLPDEKIGTTEEVPSLHLRLVIGKEAVEHSLFTVDLRNASMVDVPKMSVALLKGTVAGATLVGYGRLNATDFALPIPQPRDNRLEWIRSVALYSIDINDSNAAHYRIVVYGSGGEVIATELRI
jgi:hypothetical protein